MVLIFCSNHFSCFNFIKSANTASLKRQTRWSNSLILFLRVSLLLTWDQGFPLQSYVWPDSNTTFLARSNAMNSFTPFSPLQTPAHLILTLALNPIGHRRFDMHVCVERMLEHIASSNFSNLISIFGFPAEMPRNPQCFLRFLVRQETTRAWKDVRVTSG